VTRDLPTRPPIQKQAKSPQIPESRIRPGCETLTISAGAAAVRLALRPRRKLACFCSAPMAGFYSAVDKLNWSPSVAQVDPLFKRRNRAERSGAGRCCCGLI